MLCIHSPLLRLDDLILLPHSHYTAYTKISQADGELDLDRKISPFVQWFLMQAAFYDEKKSYEQNYIDGPPIALSKQKPKKRVITKKHKFLGFDVNVPFGIPPGPLLNSMFVKSAFEYGFDILGYKTVRSGSFPCHPFPNVLFVKSDNPLDLTSGSSLVGSSKPPRDKTKVNITNSFGVPSKDPGVWQEDVRKAIRYQGKGQLLILSFMGTVKEGQTPKEFVDDFAKTAQLARETGAKVLEANLSCPNIGNEGLVCYDLEISDAICKAIRKTIKDTPLIIKVGYYKDPQHLDLLANIAQRYAQGISYINAIQNKIVDKKGLQILPGKGRLISGVAGSTIKWAGLDMTQKLHEIRQKNKYSYELLGMGGVITPEDYREYRQAGADAVQSATGAMWNADLAYDIWKATNE